MNTSNKCLFYISITRSSSSHTHTHTRIYSLLIQAPEPGKTDKIMTFLWWLIGLPVVVATATPSIYIHGHDTFGLDGGCSSNTRKKISLSTTAIYNIHTYTIYINILLKFVFQLVKETKRTCYQTLLNINEWRIGQKKKFWNVCAHHDHWKVEYYMIIYTRLVLLCVVRGEARYRCEQKETRKNHNTHGVRACVCASVVNLIYWIC